MKRTFGRTCHDSFSLPPLFHLSLQMLGQVLASPDGGIPNASRLYKGKYSFGLMPPREQMSLKSPLVDGLSEWQALFQERVEAMRGRPLSLHFPCVVSTFGSPVSPPPHPFIPPAALPCS